MPPSAASSEASAPRRDDDKASEPSREDESSSGAGVDSMCCSAHDGWRNAATVLPCRALAGRPCQPGEAHARGDWCAKYDPRAGVWYLEDARVAEPKDEAPAADAGPGFGTRVSRRAIVDEHGTSARHGTVGAWNVLRDRSDSESEASEDEPVGVLRAPDYLPGEDGDEEPAPKKKKKKKTRRRRGRSSSDDDAKGDAKGSDSDDGAKSSRRRPPRDSK